MNHPVKTVKEKLEAAKKFLQQEHGENHLNLKSKFKYKPVSDIGINTVSRTSCCNCGMLYLIDDKNCPNCDASNTVRAIAKDAISNERVKHGSFK